MFIDLNCLLHNTDIAEDIRSLVNAIADVHVSEGEIPSVRQIWSELRQHGIEVDMSTIGHFYVSELSPRGADFFQIDEVEQQTGKSFNRTINRIINAGTSHFMTNEQSPVQAVAGAIGELFRRLETQTGTPTKSLQRELQDILLKGMKRMLPSETKLKDSRDGYAIAEEALANATKGFTDLNGMTNGLLEMQKALKDELRKQVDVLNAADPFLGQKYEDHIDEIINSAHQLMLSKTEAKKVVIDALKTVHDGEYVKEVNKTMPDGTIKKVEILNWNKLTGHVKSVSDLQEIVQMALEQKGFSQRDIDMIKQSLSKEFERIFTENIKDRSEKILERKSITKPTEIRQNYERLAEIYSLGAFEKGYEEALMKTLGVEGLSKDALNDIEDVTHKMQILLEASKNPLKVNILFRELTTQINKIVTNNMYSNDNTVKNAGLRTLFHFKMFTQASLQGILMNMFNMPQNVISNTNQLISTSVNLSKTDRRYLAKNFGRFWNTFNDVAFQNGIVEGLQAGEFSNESRLDDYLRTSFKDLVLNKSVGDKVIALYKIILTPFRILNTAYDSASKAVNQNKLIVVALNEVLKKNGIVDRNERYQKINEALYGTNFEDAIAEAKTLMTMAGIEGSGTMVKRVANDIVRYKLVTDGMVTKDELAAIIKSSYSVAGKGLGHEYQGSFKTMPISTTLSIAGKGVESFNKAVFQNEKMEALRSNDRSTYIGLDMAQMMYVGLVSKFVGGASRWLALMIQSMGLGIVDVRGFSNKYANDQLPEGKHELTEFLNNKMTHNENFFRGLTGIALAGAGYAVLAALHSGFDDDDDETSLMADFAKYAGSSYAGDRYAKRLMPPLLQLMYSYRSNTNQEGFDKQQWDYIRLLFNIDSKYSTDEKFWDIMFNIGIKPESNKSQYAKPNPEKGWGDMGRMFGEPFTAQFASYIKGWQTMTDGKPLYTRPTNFWYGLLSGGILENAGVLENLGVSNDGLSQIVGVSGGVMGQLRNARLYKGKYDKDGDPVSINDLQELREIAKSKKVLENLKAPYTSADGKTHYRKIFSSTPDKVTGKSKVDDVWEYLESTKK